MWISCGGKTSVKLWEKEQKTVPSSLSPTFYKRIDIVNYLQPFLFRMVIIIEVWQ